MQLLKNLLVEIEAQLGWGGAAGWSDRNFQDLSERIYARTDQSLSVSTLKRTWGRVKSRSKPSTTTLDALAKFAGHADWLTYANARTPAAGSSVWNTSSVPNTENVR